MAGRKPTLTMSKPTGPKPVTTPLNKPTAPKPGAILASPPTNIMRPVISSAAPKPPAPPAINYGLARGVDQLRRRLAAKNTGKSGGKR